MRCSLLVVALCVATLAPALVAHAQDPDRPARAIAHVHGNLYHVQSGEHVTVFLVTDEGIVLADPLEGETARWLAGELGDRFPGRPVRYILHTSHRYERAAGASVFPSAERIAHAAFNGELRRARDASARYRDIDPVGSSYGAHRTVTLGGRQIVLFHPDGASAPEMTVLLFADERVLFATHHPPTSTPDRFAPSTPQQVLRWIRFVNGLDFDLLISGNGSMQPKADLATFAQYLEQLVDGVRVAVDAGRPLALVQQSLRIGGSVAAQEQATHVSEAYRHMRQVRVTVYGSSLVTTLNSGDRFCGASFQIVNACTTTAGRFPANVAGVQVTLGRIGVAGEFRLGAQFVGDKREQAPSGPTPSTTHILVARRDTQISFLLRYEVIRGTRVSVGLGGGASLSGGESIWRVGRGFLADPDEYQYVSSSVSSARALGLTISTDLDVAIGSRFGIVAPVRLTYVPLRPDDASWWVADRDIYAGIGLRVTVLRRVYGS